MLAHTGTSSMNKHYNGFNCRKAIKTAGQKPNIKLALEHAAQNAPVQRFDHRVFQQKLAKLLNVSHLPFLFLEHPEFRDLLSYVRLAPSMPEVPSAKAMRRQLRDLVREQQRNVLQTLPSSAKLSPALDCWTPPFWQAFMAVTGYFLDQHWEYHRVLSVTTDNASNNKTLITSIQEATESLESNENITMIRVPCVAHVIQLSLKDLLGKMKAIPKNDTAEQTWSDDRVDNLRARKQKKEIVDTLNKIRSLAIYINGCPQRRESFYNLQTKEPKLVPIQDDATRWNSTFLMLTRARKLQQVFDDFCCQYDQEHLALRQEQWRQVDYLLSILQPFHQFTTILSKKKDVTIHLVFKIYNKLFEHLEKSAKLSVYYADTDKVDGYLYAIGTILSPQDKLQFFSTKDWDPDPESPETDYRAKYRQSFECSFHRHSEHLTEDQQHQDTPPVIMAISELESLCVLKKFQQPQTQQLLQPDELTNDNEEDEGPSTQALIASQAPSAKALGKRRQKNFTEDLDEEGENQVDDDGDVIPLPETQHRASGRVRNRSRLLDGYETSDK
ncbi:hypothetical protein PENANT_c201G08001 [Penicillium antarcticum]|uniref:HAT C-terminal dimerisation domain-containing protein n=1 Tax=Penicillium antarcticum TaxID=416450 RepID=A0A1V6P961_9EURO|nr:hypothetical protein PENANT_c201G08001 [Penicillium antarcticum]